MSYHFLTGCTGLLGSYLLRDSLLAGRKMAVLVRPSRRESPRQRIEQIMSMWDDQSGWALPRPVVLEGDLSQPDLDLDSASLRWISDNCDTMIHNAASLTFQGNDRGGEPWQSNVEGTRRVLELCRCTEIERFHHVSTAYVCGLREGRILESQADVGQAMGNDYEQSKLEAEQLVRGARFLSSRTFYRPGIIVGDSQTGYTPTYHGFYLLLRLAYMLVAQVGSRAADAPTLVEAFGLKGSERKHFVPVDWVSAIMSHILDRSEHHGQTYHLASTRPVDLSLMAEVIQEAVGMNRDAVAASTESDGTTCRKSLIEETFLDQLQLYRAYWRDDPVFDHTNTLAVASHLPCPPLERDTLLMLANRAIEDDFGRRRVRPRPLDFDAHRSVDALLRQWEQRGETPGDCLSIGLRVDGSGGGQWRLILENERLLGMEHGLGSASSPYFQLESKVFGQLVTRQLSVAQAMQSAKVIVQGNGVPPAALLNALEEVVAGCATERCSG